MRSITTARLALLPQVAAHAEPMFAVLADPAIYQYENAPPRSLEWLRERYLRLESRVSGDGHEQWLNWVLALADGTLIGYVQASVTADGTAAVAYELGSAWWGQGLGGEALGAMLAELADHHGARRFTAILKQRNERSRRLLERSGFTMAPAHAQADPDIGADEWLMERAAP
jgi:RimJ/RimL family protein N-acetyltransferase